MMKIIKEALSIFYALGRDTLKCFLGFFVGLFFLILVAFFAIICLILFAFALLSYSLRFFKWKK